MWQNCNRTGHGAARGFTLLEVLIALALLSLLAGALYGTFFSLTAGREAAPAGMEARRELRSSLDLLRRELSGTYYGRGNKRLHFVVEDRDEYGKPTSTLEFTTIAPPSPDNGSSDQIVVRYQPVVTDQKMVLTRQGFNSKMVVNGDVTQIDLEKRSASGLVEAQEILKGIPGISFVWFSEEDVVRHGLVRKIIAAYDRWENKRARSE